MPVTVIAFFGSCFTMAYVFLQFRSRFERKETAMKRALFATLIMTAMIFSLANPAAAASVLDRIVQKGELVVGVTGTQPPLNVKTKDGDIIGLDADLARMMASAMGVKVAFKTLQFADLLPALETQKVDVILSGMTMTPNRNLKVAFVGPYFISGKGILTKSRNIAVLQSPEGLNKPEFSIAALKDSTSELFVRKAAPEARHVPVASYNEALQKLFAGEIDALIADYPYCAVAAFRHKDRGLVAGESRLTFEPIGIALPADALMLNWVQNFLSLVRGSGELETATKRWFDNPSWIQSLPEE